MGEGRGNLDPEFVEALIIEALNESGTNLPFVISSPQAMVLPMFGRIVTAIVLLAAMPLGFAETLQLKDKSSVTGKILAEKKDQVVVDLGFTVLVVPKNQVVKISGEEAPPPPRKVAPSHAVAPKADKEDHPSTFSPGELPTEIFQTARSPLAERSVRELVDQLGEAVVQVRTPSGLGSGFILNEDGYLITNFHVIEGANTVFVALDSGEPRPVRVIGGAPEYDIAVVKLRDWRAGTAKSVCTSQPNAACPKARVWARAASSRRRCWRRFIASRDESRRTPNCSSKRFFSNRD